MARADRNEYMKAYRKRNLEKMREYQVKYMRAWREKAQQAEALFPIYREELEWILVE